MNANPNSPELSIVVPCHNEQGNLQELRERAGAASSALFGDSYELVLVDDGSRDETWSAIQDLARQSARVRGVKLSRNFGQQCALTAGLQHARGKRILIMDADLQDPPELLESLCRKMDEGFDVVTAKRAKRDSESAFKKLSSKLFYRLLAKIADTPIPLDTGDFRLVSRRALDAFLAMPESHRFIRGMFSWIGFAQTSIEFDRKARSAGETQYSFSKMLALATDAITSYSTVPLRLCGLLGIFAGALSLCLGVYILASFLMTSTVRGWTSLAAIVTFFGSIQLISLSVIGEYLGRAYEQSKGRPLFIVEETAGYHRDADSTE